MFSVVSQVLSETRQICTFQTQPIRLQEKAVEFVDLYRFYIYSVYADNSGSAKLCRFGNTVYFKFLKFKITFREERITAREAQRW